MSASSDEFLRALRPVLDSLDATLVPERSRRPGDLLVDWRGETVGYIRTVELHGALDRLVARVEREFDGRLADLDRSTKQAAVRSLDEQGAFLRMDGGQQGHVVQLPQCHQRAPRSSRAVRLLTTLGRSRTCGAHVLERVSGE